MMNILVRKNAIRSEGVHLLFTLFSTAATGNKCGLFAARLLAVILSQSALLVSHIPDSLCKIENKEHKVLSLRSKRIWDL